MASLTRRTCNSLPLVNSDTLTLLVCYINELCWHNSEIAQMFCTTSRLACSFWILRLCSMISRWRKFLDCTEHNAYCSVSELQQSFPTRVTGIAMFQRSNLSHSIHMSPMYLLNLAHQQLCAMASLVSTRSRYLRTCTSLVYLPSNTVLWSCITSPVQPHFHYSLTHMHGEIYICN